MLDVSDRIFRIDGEEVKALWFQAASLSSEWAALYLDDGTKQGKPVSIQRNVLIREFNGKEEIHAFTSETALNEARVDQFMKHLRISAAEGRGMRVKLGLPEVMAILARLEHGPREVGNLLAVIHGDGGHYTAEHGLEKSAADALTAYSVKVHGPDCLPKPGEPF